LEKKIKEWMKIKGIIVYMMNENIKRENGFSWL